MKHLALRVLKGIGSQSAAASTGIVMAGAMGPTGAVASGLLLGVVAAGLLVEASADEVRERSGEKSLKAWLAEVAQRYGQRLDEVLAAIAHGQEAHELASRARAEVLLAVVRGQTDQLDTVVEGQARAESLLIYLGQWLENQSEAHCEILERFASAQLQPIRENLKAVRAGVDALLEREGRESSVHRVLTEAELLASAVDESQHARLRAERLQQLLDHREFESAERFARESQLWLERSDRRVGADLRVRLYERFIDAALIGRRDRDAKEDQPVIEAAAEMADRIDALLPMLDEADRLRASSHVAYVRSLQHGQDAGLNLLKGRVDPYGLRRRIAILSDAGQLAEAAELVRGRDPAAEWAERAIHVLIQTGEDGEAQRVLDWALCRAPTRVKELARQFFADAVLGTTRRLPRSGPPSVVHRQRLAYADEVLGPLVREVLERGEPRTGLDADVLRLGVGLAAELGKEAELVVRATCLALRVPLADELADLAFNGRVQPAPDWPQRLRAEGPRQFPRLAAAVALESRNPERRLAAFRSAKALIPEAATQEQRQWLYEMLMELAQHLGEPQQRELEQIAGPLVAPNSRSARLWSLAHALRGGATDLAEAIEELRDEQDALWLQVHGLWLLRSGKPPEAVAELGRAAMLIRRHDAISEAAGLALAHQQWATAAPLLERLVQLDACDDRVRASLAGVYQRLERNFEAATLLLDLFQRHPSDGAYAEGAAGSLVLSGRPVEAVTVLEQLCGRPEPPRQGVMQLAQLLVNQGEPERGFALLQANRSRFWSSADFVGTYWSVAIAAEEEEAAHEAIVQMRTLQARGEAPEEILVVKSLDDVLEMHQAHIEAERRRAQLLLNGRVPWLAVEEARGEPVYRGWSRRIARRLWVLEEPLHVAGWGVYATHGFVVAEERGKAALVQLKGPPRGTPVVADLTALITLHALGALEVAASYCGRLHVPARYLFKMFTDSDRLRLHQPSIRTLILRVREMVSSGLIAGVLADSPPHSVSRIVSEHYLESEVPEGVYHLADLLESLRRGGVASDEELARLARLARRPATTAGERPRLELGDALRIELSTLGTLHNCGLLDRTVERFRVSLLPEDQRSLQADAFEFERQEGLRQAHLRLWGFIRDHRLVEHHSLSEEGGGDDPSGDGTAPGVSLAAAALADRLGLPLLVDDRCIQTQVYRSGGGARAAFGTADLIDAMASHDHIDLATHAKWTRQLIDWGYRFHLPGDELLLYWAGRSQGAPPGPDLQAVAVYFHACMRDPGLFGGFENTDPPTALAMQLRNEIESSVGRFVGGLWAEAVISEAAARELTAWALCRMLPSPPLSLEPRSRLLADFGCPLFFSALLVRLARGVDLDRSRRGVKLVAEVLGMPWEGVVRQAVELIDDVG